MDGEIMGTFLEKLFVHNWQRKALSLIAAVIIWILVSQSVTVTRTLANIPVKIEGLPSDKTIVGLLPSGIMSDRITLTLNGTKSVIQDLTPDELEVVVNARDKGDQWIVHVDKKSLVSSNQDVDLTHNINEVAANDFIIDLVPLVTEKITIIVTKPTGEAPAGYQFVDVWPQRLFQTISGPKNQVEELKNRGLQLTFDLNEIGASQLNLIESTKGTNKQEEIAFMIPQSWKKVSIPYLNDALQDINDPDAEHLRIDFLRKELLPLETSLPIQVFFPYATSSTINPETYSLQAGHYVKKENGLYFMTSLLYVKDVSRLFLDVVRNNLELLVVAAPSTEPPHSLPWSVQFVNEEQLENTYIEKAVKELYDKRIQNLQPQLRDTYLRNRFRNYMRQLELFIAPDKKLLLDIQLEDHSIIIKAKD
jgi:hypothetical protein